MKHFINQSKRSYAGRMNYGGAKFRKFALFPLMLFMLLLLPTNMVAQTDYDTSVTLKELAGDPVGNTNETYKNLFDGKKENGNSSKWCGAFDSEKGAYVIFEASKAGVPVGYTITTGNDNEEYNCRNPLSWKLYGNNTGKDDAWTLIDEVSEDKVLKDENNTSYDFKCECSTSYKYFKWEITAIHSGGTLQVGEFELKLNTCSHKNADGSDALGEVINTVEPTCTEHGYTTHKCSICHLIVKEYLNDELKPHTLTHHALKDATCTEAGNIEYWQCSVCNKLFSDEATTKEITDAASLVIPAKGHTFDNKGTCTVCQYKDPRYDLFNNLDGITGVTITDNGSYPWQMLDLKAEGMENLGFTFPEGSNVLMSSNYLEKGSSSETVIRLNVSKPLLLTSQVLVSSQNTWDKFDIYVDNKLDLRISGEKQTECKVLLSVGEHSLKLSYQKDNGIYKNADRAFLYNLKTSTTIDDYVADYESSNNTLTFKRITSDNLEDLDFHSIVVLRKAQTVSDMCSLLGIDTWRIKNIVFEENFKTYAPTSLNSFFKYLNELQTITNLKYLNTANVTDMSDMFYKCSKLSSLDLSNFNTANVTNMYEMFCDCNNLSSLDLSNFNTAKVTNMGNMFENCNKLTSLDLTSFNTAKVEYMWKMFYNCSALTTIYASDKFVTDKVANGRLMFSGCTNLKGYDSSKTDYTYANYSTDGYFCRPAYAEFDESTGTLTFKCGTSIPEGTYMLNVGKSYPKWYAQRENIKKVVFDTSLASTRATNCYAWFSGCKNLTDIEGIENLNTENVTNMNSMFDRCSALTSLDLTNFNTAKVSDMSYMFMGCTALTTIFVSDKFVTNQVTSSDNMFHMCINLIGAIEYDGNNTNNKDYANYETGYFTPEGGFHAYAVFDEGTGTLTFARGADKPAGAYDLNEGNAAPEWNSQKDYIAKVVFAASFAYARPTSCYKWFYECTNLTEIKGIENLNTQNVKDMSLMFYCCSGLTSLDVSNFDTQNVEDMSDIFNRCTGLTSLDVSNFNTQKVTNMNEMFYYCTGLTSLDVSNFNTQKVTNMNFMFYGCKGLASLDISNFDTEEVTSMAKMFQSCSGLKTIYVSDKFVTTKVENGYNMFYGCTSLKGAIDYDDSKIDHTYANCDTGYFTPGCAYAVFDEGTGTLTFKCGLSKPEGAYDLNEGNNIPEWRKSRVSNGGLNTIYPPINITKVVFDASFAYARPTSCYKWFYICNDLTEINGIENLNTEKVTNMGSMFFGCYGLTSLDVSNFNTQNVEDMSSMFWICSTLTSLDLSNFDTKEVTNMSKMFWDSSALKTIYVSDKFVTTKVSSGADMFKGCTNLKGFIEQNKNKDKIDHRYANYKTGYFTKLVVRNGDERYGITGETTQLTVDNLVFADNKDFVAYEPFTATAASYNRTMKEGTTWATLCLPFEVSLEGQNFRAFNLLSANEGTNTIELEEIETSIEAGTPVIIKMTNGATKLDFSVANKEIAKDIQTSKTDNGNYQLQGLYTHKEFSEYADNNCYIVKGNKLMNPAKLLENSKVTRVASKPFRAYMVDKSSAPAAGAKMFSIGFDDDSTTAIDTLNTIANDKAEYYDLQGKRLNEPQKGINIVKRNGKTMKVIIK